MRKSQSTSISPFNNQCIQYVLTVIDEPRDGHRDEEDPREDGGEPVGVLSLLILILHALEGVASHHAGLLVQEVALHA